MGNNNSAQGRNPQGQGSQQGGQNQAQDQLNNAINIQSTLETFDPVRYQGRWLEIARLPNRFETLCTQSEAEYRWDSRKTQMRIHNKCSTSNGDNISINGIGTIPNPKFPGKLDVTFDMGGEVSVAGNNGNMKGQYWVYWTDYDKWSIVGNQQKTYYWILSRQITISLEDFNLLVMYSKSIGFNLNNLVVTPGVVITETNDKYVMLENQSYKAHRKGQGERKVHGDRRDQDDKRRQGGHQEKQKEKRHDKTRFSSDFSR
jgi:apolipoprotein D and lipocalin family protein